MDKWFNSKWFVRAISLAFAILLYVFVNIEEAGTSQSENSIFPTVTTEEQTLDEVPVEIRMDSENYVVSGVPETVSVTFEGPASILTPTTRQQNFDIFVDLQGLEEGEHTVEIEYENVPKEISVYIEPKTIDITIEERVTKEFNVSVDFINTDKLPAGYELGDYEVKPETITITSSKSVVDQIAIVKVFIDVTGLNEPINNREVPVNVYDGQGNALNVRVEPENAVVSVDVKNPSKSVPLSVKTKGKLPDGLTLLSAKANIQEVKVFATTDILNEIEGLSTEDIDLSKVKKSGTIDTKLDLPEGVKVPGIDKVEVSIELEQKRTIDDIPIDIENEEDEQEVTILQPSNPVMSVTVIGKEEDVSGLGKEDIQLVVDVKGLEPGEHRLPVTIVKPDNIKIDGELEEVLVEIS